MTGSQTRRPAARRALLICNGQFESLGIHLDGVTKDADNLTRVLGNPERAGFEVVSLLDKGLWEVRKAIASACATAGPDDTLLIWYSGASLCDTQGELLMPVADSDGQYLMATSIEADYILAQMRRSRCRRFVLVIDGCHSGAFFRHNRGIPDGLVALTSCSADETAMDTPDGGAFTNSFVRALTTSQADADHDGSVTVDDVYEFIRKDPTLARESSAHPQKWLWNLPEPIVLVRTTMSVFLSYARADKDLAEAVSRAFEQRGILVWRDVLGIPGGAEWRDSLVEALAKTQAVVLLMTPGSMESKWVRRELEFADGKGRPIFPLLSRGVTPPDWFVLQFGGLERKEIDITTVDATVTAMSATIRASLAARPSPG